MLVLAINLFHGQQIGGTQRKKNVDIRESHVGPQKLEFHINTDGSGALILWPECAKDISVICEISVCVCARHIPGVGTY